MLDEPDEPDEPDVVDELELDFAGFPEDPEAARESVR